jgi:zinc/manganese transport system permease protein
MIEFLALPALACVALVGIHAYFGLHVLKRNVIFVDLALAQVAALGATVAFTLGHLPQSPASYAYSLAFAILTAILLASTRAWSSRIPQEALIGIIYVVAAAAAILLVDRAPQGAEHIRQILTGNILTVTWEELRWALPLYLAVGLLHPRLKIAGWTGEFLFYALFGLVVTSSVALAGVLLVFAFLIIPAAIGVLQAQGFGRQLLIAWGVGTVVAFAGLAASYLLDLSTGATLVCAYGVALAITGLARWKSRWLGSLRWAAAAVLVLCAFAIVLFPRADQPLLDAAERLVPKIRWAYMDEKSRRIAAEAEAYAERYRGEAGKLRDSEAQRRWKGAPLDELEVRRVASFLKSYNEMVNGETFVAREVRSRARAEHRFAIAAVFLLLALPWLPWRSIRRPRAWSSWHGPNGPEG